MTALRRDPPLPGLTEQAPWQDTFLLLAPGPAPPGAEPDSAGPPAHRSRRTRQWPRRLAWTASASLALHAAVLAGLLPYRRGEAPVELPPQQEVELIDEAPMRRGDAAPAAAAAAEQPPDPDAAPPSPTAAAEPSPEPPQPAAPPTELGQGGVPMPLPYRPPPPRQASAAQPSPARSPRPDAPQVNLGDEEDREGLQVVSEDFVPPQPDAARRNQPPRYPQDAARRGAQGTVQLRVRVTEAGRALTAMVARSSGDASLDRSAMEAVMRWHFTPAKRGGVAVPFDYYISIRFVIGNG